MMNEILAVILFLMLFSFTVAGGERADSTGLGYQNFYAVPIDTVLLKDTFYARVCDDPVAFFDWLYYNYHVLDAGKWEAIHYEGFLDYGDKIYIKTKGN